MSFVWGLCNYMSSFTRREQTWILCRKISHNNRNKGILLGNIAFASGDEINDKPKNANFLISQPNPMVWPFIRIVSMRRFEWMSHHWIWVEGYENCKINSLSINVQLEHRTWCSLWKRIICCDVLRHNNLFNPMQLDDYYDSIMKHFQLLQRI